MRKMRRILGICIILLLSISFGLSYAANSGIGSQSRDRVPAVDIFPKDTTGIETGETFSVNVVVEDAENLYGFDVEFVWNPLFVEYVDHEVMAPVENCENGVLHSPMWLLRDELNASLGMYRGACASVSPAEAFDGNGTLVVIEFELLSSSSQRPYGLASVELSDDKGQPLLISGSGFSGLIVSEDVWDFIRRRDKDPGAEGWLRWWIVQMHRRWGG